MPITLDLSNLRDTLAPLFHRYPRQTSPQGAHVELEEGGAVSADWNGEIGNGVPVAVYHRRTLRWSVPSAVSGQALADYLEGEGLALLERVHAGHATQWDGANLVGRLSEDAQEASQELDQALQEVETADVQRVDDWLGSLPWGDVWPEADTLAHCVEEWKRQALRDGTTLDGDLEAEILSRLWASSRWPSELAKAGRWTDARRLWDHWKEAASAAGHQARDLAADVEDMADAVEARQDGANGLAWLPQEVQAELARRRDALGAGMEVRPT